MSDKEEAEKAQISMLRNIFEGIKGRQPRTDRELEEWLASAEGKTAAMFELTPASRWGETGRS